MRHLPSSLSMFPSLSVGKCACGVSAQSERHKIFCREVMLSYPDYSRANNVIFISFLKTFLLFVVLEYSIYSVFWNVPYIPCFNIFDIFLVNVYYIPYFRIFREFRNPAVTPFHQIGSPFEKAFQLCFPSHQHTGGFRFSSFHTYIIFYKKSGAKIEIA